MSRISHEENRRRWNKWKEVFFVALLLLTMFAVVLYLKEIGRLLGGVLSIVKPVLYGFLIAFILNVPMSALERKLEQYAVRIKILRKEKVRNILSLILTLLFVLLLIVVLMLNVIPHFFESIMTFTENIDENIDGLMRWMDEMKIHFEPMTQFVTTIHWQDVVKQVTSSVGGMMGNVVHTIPQVGSSIISLFISLIIAIYVLMDKKRLKRQLDEILMAYAGEKVGDRVNHILRLFTDTYSDFLTGQCTESCILACLMFLVLTISGIPYAGIISIMAGVFQLVPYVGAFLAWIVGALLILLTAPQKVLFYLIIFQVVQFCEGQFIYPRIVGGSVGLPPLFTLIAVFIGGKLFGLIGMLFFIPLTSVLYQLIREDVHKKLMRTEEVQAETSQEES